MVLIVESDASVRALIVELLDEAGFAVVQTDRGDTGLLLVEEHSPSVVLVDHVLADMSGLDFFDHLRGRSTTRHIPVVMLSGRIQQLHDVGSGPDRVVPMPFDIDVLVAHVEQLAHLSRVAVA
jgi:two-component system phosphate regulon response regulator PhoB